MRDKSMIDPSSFAVDSLGAPLIPLQRQFYSVGDTEAKIGWRCLIIHVFFGYDSTVGISFALISARNLFISRVK